MTSLPRNQVPEWRAHYLDYKRLKKEIKSAAHDARTNENNSLSSIPERHQQGEDGIPPSLTTFFYVLDRNVETVDAFYRKKVNELQRRFGILFERSNTSIHAKVDMSDMEDLVAAFLDLRSDFQRLLWYAEVNKRGFVKILKKLDKKLGVSEQAKYLQSKVGVLPFASPLPVQICIQRINAWLSEAGNGMNVSASSSELMMEHPSSNSLSRTSSFQSLVMSAKDSEEMEMNVKADDANAVKHLMQNIVGDDNRDTVQRYFLKRAVLEKSLNCIRLLLSEITMVDDDKDVNQRNIFHKHITWLGREYQKQNETKEQTQKQPTTTNGSIYIEPAVKENQHTASTSHHNPRLWNRYKPKEQVSDLGILQFLLDNLRREHHITLLSRDISGRTPLHYAAFFGLVADCELLINALLRWKLIDGYDTLAEKPEWLDNDGLSPVALAIMGHHERTVKMLLGVSARDPLSRACPLRDVKDIANNCLILAARANCPAIISDLREAGFNLQYRDEGGETALHVATRLGYSASVVELLALNDFQEPADTEIAESTFGWTPLFIAAVEGYYVIAEILLQQGDAEPNKMDFSGWTAHEHAYFRGHLDVGRMLKVQVENSEKVSNSSNGPSSAQSESSSLNSKSSSSIGDPIPPPFPAEPVKSFGHRYLTDKTMIIVNLGSMDLRKDVDAIKFERIPLEKVGATHLDTALSLVVSAQHADGEPHVVDLPVQEGQNVEPIVFHCYDFNAVQLCFDIVPTYAGSKNKIIGRAVALPGSINSQVGKTKMSLSSQVTLPLLEVSTLSVIGELNINFKKITPFIHPNMAVGPNSTYWKSLTTSRVIGHRGMGKNAPSRKSLQLGENTVQSFIAAANLGASYVEFDVQLTKDLVPVIYHDFLVGETGFDAPMHTLTLEQFLAAKGELHHEGKSKKQEFARRATDDLIVRRTRSLSLDVNAQLSEGDSERRMQYTRDYKTKGFKGNARGSSIQAPFTTLEEVFKSVPKSCGFNIECKFPMLDESEAEEMDVYAIEMNQWVDTVLKVVYDNSDGRDIIFSSFHPDICLLLSLKQPNIPILFLTDAGATKMADVRASSLQEAIRFAAHWNLLGIVSACEVFECLRLVK